jgi:phage-related protein
MRLVRVARVVWDLVAMTDDDGANVLTELDAIDPGYKHTETMRALIERTVPRDGPPVHNDRRCSPLGDGIFEFKAGPERGKKLRVLWFYDAGVPPSRRQIICTHSFLKDTRKTPPQQKARAVRMRRQYLEAKRTRTLPQIEERGNDDN